MKFVFNLFLRGKGSTQARCFIDEEFTFNSSLSKQVELGSSLLNAFAQICLFCDLYDIVLKIKYFFSLGLCISSLDLDL